MSFVYPKPGAPPAPSGSSNDREDPSTRPALWLHETPPHSGCYTPCNHRDHSLKPDGLQGREALPDWWNFECRVARPLDTIIETAFRVLCLVSLGHPNLGDVWDICNSDEETWLRGKDRLWNRVNTITIVAGLLLGSTAAFATTSPPRPDLVDYATLGSYRCILASFGLTLGGLIAGSTILFVMTKCHANWFRDTLMGSRSRVCCTLVIIGYPFIVIGIATAILAFGLLAAAWRSSDSAIHIGGPFVMLVPCMLIPMFLHTQTGGGIFLVWVYVKGIFSGLIGLKLHRVGRSRRSALTAPAAASVTI
ncbi:hypothetical protein DENSPDRAFT_615588 [Dentipellis sp. KUC8613]|nr:hypothetical protein DENSPDRAFT_615588 [Dentipellis sp. KUC8613]